MSVEETIEVINKHNSFLITSHTSPDGDGIGSQFALHALLKGMGKHPIIVNDDPLPELYNFLPKLWHQMKDEIPRLVVDAVFVIECATLDRIGSPLELITEDMVVVNIDHHVSNEKFGKINWVDSGRSCVGEMIYELYRKLECPIGKEEALFLYLAVVTDTGSFRYANTTSLTHRVAGELISLGAKPDEVAERLYETHSISAMRLLGLALSTLRRSEDGQVAWLYVTRDMMAQSGAEPAEAEGLVNYARSIRRVKVALSFKETQDPDEVKVSFRSKGMVDVDAVARAFGGGGHPQASGCLVKGKIDEVIPLVLAKVKETIGSASK